jgi:hypothetical protein
MNAFFLSFYRVTGMALADYLLGTLILALFAVLAGEITISLVYLVNRDHIQILNDELTRFNGLSKKADEAGLERAYTACNRSANDAYGRLYFNQFGLSAASLWPAFFALDFMQKNFSAVSLPVAFTGMKANYVFMFIVCYVSAKMIFKRLKVRMPYFSFVGKLLASEKPNPMGIQ